jgi:hypothetical protein
MIVETPKMPFFIINNPHEGPEFIYCLKMEPQKFDNAKDDTICYVCTSIANYNDSLIPNNVYIIDSSNEYKQIGTYDGSTIKYV